MLFALSCVRSVLSKLNTKIVHKKKNVLLRDKQKKLWVCCGFVKNARFLILY